MIELEKLKEIFLTDVDEETRVDNLATIADWEKSLIHHESYQEWRNHDITQSISDQATQSYKDACMILATARDLTPAEQHQLWAKQDAALWILSLTKKDVQTAIDYIHKEITAALATN